MSKSILIVVLIILLGGLFFYQANKATQTNQSKETSKNDSNQNKYRPTLYSPTELNDLLKKDRDKYVVIDVRTKQEYDKGHLPGAINVNYYDRQALKKAVGNKIPITYCAFSAMRGPYAAYSLWQAGFKNVGVLSGGIAAWAEDIQNMDSADPNVKTVFGHPKNIFPERPKSDYPKGQGEVEFNITAKRFEFVPNQIVVKWGQKVTLNLTSLDVTHGFALPEFGIEEELLPNEPVTITFIADRKGDFPFVCSVICGAGHNHASMVGNLIVE